MVWSRDIWGRVIQPLFTQEVRFAHAEPGSELSPY